ncbi:MAG: N-acetylmuramoyl-L-alanine amidase [Sarcina sp.]
MKTYKILAITAAIGLFSFLGTVQAQATVNDTSNASNYEIQKIQLREDINSDDDEITFELRDRAEKMFQNDPQKANLKTTETNYGNGLIIKDKNLQWNDELDLTNKPKQLVLHHIEASRPNSNIPVEDVHSWHLANGWSGIGYHFYINKKGEIFRGRPENAIGAHAKGFNTGSLGIAVEGKYGSETMNLVQKEAVIKLSKYLRQKYDIDTINGHGELMPTDCPGKNYPLNEIRNTIRQEVIVDGDIITWKMVNNEWYYLNTWTGEKLTGWQLVDNQWYYMDSTGVMQTGWQLVDGEWYYMHANGAMQTGWQLVDGEWYYMHANGVMQKGWQLIDGEWYYMHANGVMQKGWQFINNEWYYLNSSGVMQKDWQLIDNEWYYLNSNGVMQTGWLKLSENIYYLDSSGKMYKEGWHQIGNNWHYMFEDGSLAQNTTIQGIKIDENGIAKI